MPLSDVKAGMHCTGLTVVKGTDISSFDVEVIDVVDQVGGPALSAGPAGPAGSFPPQPMRPGASLAAGLSSGSIAISAVGTATYVDGRSVWGFGHPLDDAGRRNLFLQDAYVYTVVPNPNG